MATKTQINDLAQALKEAYSRAQEVSIEDGGTCNFDTPQLILTGWREAEIREAFDAAGLRCYIQKSGKSHVVDVMDCTKGQGDLRTEMAEAARDSLKASGYEAYVYYQMD